MRVLVTGGAGYIGSVVCEELVNDNHEVVVYDSLYKGHRAAVDGADFVKADLRDVETLKRTLRDKNIDRKFRQDKARAWMGTEIPGSQSDYRVSVGVDAFSS